jgi:coproporphyrinogen III oxidase-like Fe-S oxidoreductase
MPLSFYVHIPYCIKRCGYCDFNTYTPNELQDGASLEIVSNYYIDAVLLELEAASSVLKAKVISSISEQFSRIFVFVTSSVLFAEYCSFEKAFIIP